MKTTTAAIVVATLILATGTASADDIAKGVWRYFKQSGDGVKTNMKAMFGDDGSFIQMTAACVDNHQMPIVFTANGFADHWGFQDRKFPGSDLARLGFYGVEVGISVDGSSTSTVEKQAMNNEIWNVVAGIRPKSGFRTDIEWLLTIKNITLEFPFADGGKARAVLDMTNPYLHEFVANCQRLHAE